MLRVMIDWITGIKIAGEVAAALATIWGTSKFVVKPSRRAWASWREFYKNVNFAAKEMKPNGGTSLRDSVEGLKHSIDAILSTVVRLDQRQIAIANHSEKGIFEADLNGDTIFVNRAYTRLIGRSPEEILGKGWKLSIHPDDRDNVTEEWYTCVKERRDFVMAYKILRPDHTTLVVDAHAYVLRDLKGQTIGYMGFLVPVNSKEEASLT